MQEEQKFHVHAYMVARIKVAGITAGSPIEACRKADDVLGSEPGNLLRRTLIDLPLEKQDELQDAIVEIEDAEELVGYLVDRVGDSEYWESVNVEPDFTVTRTGESRDSLLRQMAKRMALSELDDETSLLASFINEARQNLVGYLLKSESEQGYWSQHLKSWVAAPVLATWFEDPPFFLPAAKEGDITMVPYVEAKPFERKQSLLERVMALLKQSDAISIDDTKDLLTQWDLSPEITGDPDNQAVCLTWTDDGAAMLDKLTEGGISNGRFTEDGKFICENHEGEKVSIRFYKTSKLIIPTPEPIKVPRQRVAHMGYLQLPMAERLEFDFDVPEGASTAEKDAAFLDALKEMAEVNYLPVGIYDESGVDLAGFEGKFKRAA